MSRYIDIEPYEKEGWYLQKTYYCTYGAGVKTTPLISIPTADIEAEPIKHGRWTQIVYPWYECSECGERTAVTNLNGEVVWNYCPNCGALMDERDGGENGR